MTYQPTQEWQIQALKDLQETTLTYEQIGQRHGRSRDTIYRFARMVGVVRPKGCPTSMRKAEDDEPQSSIHKAIGVRLSMYGHREKLKHELGVSWVKLRRMELGVHDFTLRELQIIEALIDVPVAELITPPKSLRATA